jgi:hypothetical protein
MTELCRMGVLSLQTTCHHADAHLGLLVMS